jgi:polysaccharide biosynthesis transport protein
MATAPTPDPLPATTAPPPSSGRFAEARRFFERIQRYQIVFRRFWWALPACVAICLGAVSFLSAKLPPAFQSKGRIWMRGKIELNENRGFNEDLVSQVELLQSTTVYNGALEGLRRLHPDWTVASTNADPTAPPPFKLEVKEIPKASVFELRVTGADPDTTRAFLDALMQAYLDFRKQERLRSSESTRGSFTNQLERLEKDIFEQQEKARKFQIDNQLIVFQEQGSSAAAYLARINRQLTALHLEAQLTELLNPDQLTEIASKWMDDSSPEPLPGQNSSLDLLRSMSGPKADSYKASQQLVLLKVKRDELARFLRPTHPKMVKLNKSIDDLDQLLDVFRAEGLRQLKSRKSSIELQIKSLEVAYKEWEKKAAEASVQIAEYDRIQQELRRLQNFYDRLAATAQSVDVSQSLGQDSFSVLDQASPATPVNRKVKFLLLGLLLGLCLGFAVLYLVEQFDDRFGNITELRSQLSELVVGQIPNERHRRKTPLPLLRAQDPRHEFVEAFTTMRSGLVFGFTDQERPRIMVVTSSVPQEGKSTVAANFAITLALGGSRVLLIDADLRRAAQHKQFGLPRIPGLAEVISTTVPTVTAVQPTSIPGLSVLTSGETSSGNPGALFLKETTDVFLKDVARRHDFVIIDSAPVLATDDTANLAPKVDGVIFVVRGGFTSARVAQEALSMLRQRKSRILGLVFNRSTSTIGEAYYYGTYHQENEAATSSGTSFRAR